MTEFQLQLLRRREHARRQFASMAARADDEGCVALASRLRRLGWQVGGRMVTPTPPALANKLMARLPKLIAIAKTNPNKSWLELQPLARRKKIRANRCRA